VLDRVRGESYREVGEGSLRRWTIGGSEAIPYMKNAVLGVVSYGTRLIMISNAHNLVTTCKDGERFDLRWKRTGVASARCADIDHADSSIPLCQHGRGPAEQRGTVG